MDGTPTDIVLKGSKELSLLTVTEIYEADVLFRPTDSFGVHDF